MYHLHYSREDFALLKAYLALAEMALSEGHPDIAAEHLEAAKDLKRAAIEQRANEIFVPFCNERCYLRHPETRSDYVWKFSKVIGNDCSKNCKAHAYLKAFAEQFNVRFEIKDGTSDYPTLVVIFKR